MIKPESFNDLSIDNILIYLIIPVKSRFMSSLKVYYGFVVKFFVTYMYTSWNNLDPFTLFQTFYIFIV